MYVTLLAEEKKTKLKNHTQMQISTDSFDTLIWYKTDFKN